MHQGRGHVRTANADWTRSVAEHSHNKRTISVSEDCQAHVMRRLPGCAGGTGSMRGRSALNTFQISKDDLS